MAMIEEVFGVTSRPVLSYVERDDVDSNFREVLQSHRNAIEAQSAAMMKEILT